MFPKCCTRFFHRYEYNPSSKLKHIYITISTFTSVRLFDVIVPSSHITFFHTAIPAVVPQTVTNKSCLVCVKSEKYVLLVTIRPLGSMR